MQARYIVTGLFERAKRYWTIAVFGKVVVAFIGFLVAIRPSFAAGFAIAILLAEAVSATCFYRADALKSQAEPVLSRLDLDESLGWSLPRDYLEELSADYGGFAQKGQRIRGGDAYFAPGEASVGWSRLSKNVLESALYTRTIAAAARNVIFTLFAIMLCIVAAVSISGAYRQFFQGTNAAGEFLVDALLLLVTMDLLPLGFQYNTLRCEATRTRSRLSSLPRDAAEAAVLPIALQYQLARAVAPLLPTFAFLKKRFPLGAIWSAADDS
jgi:hypothetical protein